MCTDDSGVFGTTLSRELALAGACFKLAPAELAALCRAALGFAFLAEPDRAELQARTCAQSTQLSGGYRLHGSAVRGPYAAGSDVAHPCKISGRGRK